MPFTGSRDVDPLTELLKVAGVDAKADTLVSEEDDVNSSLGPVGIEAARLLGCYLRGMFADFDSEEMASKKLYRRLVVTSTEQRMVRRVLLGVDTRHGRRDVDFFAASNDRFARDVWDSDWDIAMPVDKETSAVRLLDLPPPTIEKVNRYVFSLSQRFATAAQRRPAPE